MNTLFWSKIINKALNKYPTPFHLYSQKPIIHYMKELHNTIGIGVENWLSMKTLPIKPVLKLWQTLGYGIEVTSEYELIAAQRIGFSPNKIIVNGVAKHSWKESCWTEQLRVNFDSLNEVKLMSQKAKSMNWLVGFRFHSDYQFDPENPEVPDQFGLSLKEFIEAYSLLSKSDIKLNSLHLHLRSNIPSVSFLKSSIEELFALCLKLGIEVKQLDLGGGLPANNVKQNDKCWQSSYTLNDLSVIVKFCRDKFNSLDNIILENGRFVLSNSGVLVLSINDIKYTNGQKHVICDGGRTNHALPSDWEKHEIMIMPPRVGDSVSTRICGPTCMAFDCIDIIPLSVNIQIGDKLIYFDTGAYSLQWENRFSHPLARVLWHDSNDKIYEIRNKEGFNSWYANLGDLCVD